IQAALDGVSDRLEASGIGLQRLAVDEGSLVPVVVTPSRSDHVRGARGASVRQLAVDGDVRGSSRGIRALVDRVADCSRIAGDAADFRTRAGTLVAGGVTERREGSNDRLSARVALLAETQVDSVRSAGT